MESIIGLIPFLLMFGLVISIGYKVEKTFDYLKIINPAEFSDKTSFMSTRTNFKKLNSSYSFEMFLPYFKRNKVKESKNWKLKKTGDQIIKSLYGFWIFLSLLIIFNFMYF